MPTENPVDPHQMDFVLRGSDEHVALLGLEKGEDGEYTLANPEDLIRLDPTGKLAEIVLKSKVGELNSEFPAVQSKDPRQPFYAPPMWLPRAEGEDDGRPVIRGIV